MILVIDIGNTQVTLGVYQADELVVHWRFASTVHRTEDENWLLIRALCEAQSINWHNFTGMAISSVVPNATPSFQHMARKYLDLEPLVVDASLDVGIKILYDNPYAVGADRICNAVAGYARWRGPLIILDFGTATTFDVISETGDYLGGIIAPGIQTTANVLHQVASLLPKVELKFPDKIIATNTQASIQAGLMYGAVEMIDGLIERIKDEFNQDVMTIATGGLAKLVVPKLITVQQIESMLTLNGLLIIYKRVTKMK